MRMTPVKKSICIDGWRFTKIKEGTYRYEASEYRLIYLFARISLFSTTRYSSQSLLPKDPPAFTIASNDSQYTNGNMLSTKKKSRLNITLEDFPLPDGNWRWASKEWMVDMRDEHVQYDGFQYNWYFRKDKWRNKPGRLNAGAWVRRRRWIRLMERVSTLPTLL